MLDILDECGSEHPAIAQLQSQSKVLQQSHTEINSRVFYFSF